MRAKPGKVQRIRVGLPIDEQQIRLDMALAVSGPVSAKLVIMLANLQRLIADKRC
jgi:hypothetical protein